MQTCSKKAHSLKESDFGELAISLDCNIPSATQGHLGDY